MNDRVIFGKNLAVTHIIIFYSSQVPAEKKQWKKIKLHFYFIMKGTCRKVSSLLARNDENIIMIIKSSYWMGYIHIGRFISSKEFYSLV